MIQSARNVSPGSNEERNTYVVDHITDELLKLLKEKPIEDISITELCSLAGVGRVSFYRNFDSKQAVLKAYMCKIFSECKVDGKADHDALHTLIFVVFCHLEQHRDFYTLLYERDLVWLLKDVIISLCGPKPDQEKEAAYASAFVAYSLYGWIEVWLQRGMRESAEEMADLFTRRGL